jgi:hypothetical protein
VAGDAEKFGYWFDNFFATNPMAKVYVLCAANVFFMIIFGTCFHLAGSQGGDLVENFWMGFTFAADMAEDVSSRTVSLPLCGVSLWLL